MSFGHFASNSQFYIFGRRRCTQSGYLQHAKEYKSPDFHDHVDLSGRVYMITDACCGIGKEVARYVACRGGSVYMVCREAAKAEVVRLEILASAPHGVDVRVLVADCGLQRDVRRMWEDFQADSLRLDGLVCLAGSPLPEKTITEEGVEATFATNLLAGSYLLGKLAMPLLAASGGRLILVSSGTMYNTKFPQWEVAAGLLGEYSGEQAFAYMKRGQVLLAERWASTQKDVKVVSAHPGWFAVEALDDSDSERSDSEKSFKKSPSESLRSTWEASEGLCWLLACNSAQLESGAFYLDREPQVKHMAGPFFTEGSFTKNSSAEVDAMMQQLELWTSGQGPSAADLLERYAAQAVRAIALNTGRLRGVNRQLSLPRFMGRWYIVGHVPSYFDKNTVNCVETYEWNEEKKRVDIAFTKMNRARTKTSEVKKKAKVINNYGTEWKVRVSAGPIGMSLSCVIAHCEDDYSACIVGNPDRSHLYIMARTAVLSPAERERLKNLAESLGFKRAAIKDVPQMWDAATAGA